MKKQPTTTLIIFIFRLIPLGLRRMFFRLLLSIFYYVAPRHRLITLHNLRRAFPDKSQPELIKIAKGVYRHLGIMAAEFFEIPYLNKDNLHRYVEFEGLEHMQRALEEKKGVLSIVAHFGNWEMMTAALPIALHPMEIVYRPLDSAILENLTSWVRTVHGNTMLPKEGAARKIFKLLAQNKIIGILVDQNVAIREGIFIDFFDRPANTAVGLAKLALHTGAPVLPAFMIRMEDGRYKFLIQGAIEPIRTGNKDRDVLLNTQRYARIIEDVVRQYPDQYFWVHQRWKTQRCQKE